MRFVIIDLLLELLFISLYSLGICDLIFELFPNIRYLVSRLALLHRYLCFEDLILRNCLLLFPLQLFQLSLSTLKCHFKLLNFRLQFRVPLIKRGNQMNPFVVLSLDDSTSLHPDICQSLSQSLYVLILLLNLLEEACHDPFTLLGETLQ